MRKHPNFPVHWVVARLRLYRPYANPLLHQLAESDPNGTVNTLWAENEK